MPFETHHHRHHRKRRFHRPREALGSGFYLFDVVRRRPAGAAAPETSAVESEELSEREKVQQSARKVWWICAGVILFAAWAYSVAENWIWWRTWLSH